MRTIWIVLTLIPLIPGLRAEDSAALRFGSTTFYEITPITYRTGTFFRTADTNGDGLSDLIVVSPGGTKVSVFFGDAAGKLRNRLDSDLGGIVYAGGNAALGDFNSDGFPDLVIAMNKGPLRLLTGDGKGGFSGVSTLERVGPNPDCPGPLAVADVNRDGKPDIVASQCQNSVGVFLGAGGGSFRSPVLVKVPGLNRSVDQTMAVAEFNGDDIPDIAVATITGVSLLLGKGDGTFADPLPVETGIPIKLLAADLNRDGKTDLLVLPVEPAVRPAPMFGSAGNSVVVHLGDGKGRFEALPPSPVIFSNFPTDGGFPNHVEIADLTGDGIPDLVLTKQQFSYQTEQTERACLLYTGRGDGTFRAAGELRNTRPPAKYPRFSFGLLDLNGDRKSDLVFLDDRTGNQVGVVLNSTRSSRVQGRGQLR
jgi:hypothetical protein